MVEVKRGYIRKHIKKAEKEDVSFEQFQEKMARLNLTLEQVLGMAIIELLQSGDEPRGIYNLLIYPYNDPKDKKLKIKIEGDYCGRMSKEILPFRYTQSFD